MRIGITVAQCDRLARPAAVATAVRAAEQLGYSSVWVCSSAPDPAGVLLGAGVGTSRVRLGTGIVVASNPDLVALGRSLAAVDVVALEAAADAEDGGLDAVLDALDAGRTQVLLGGRTPAALDRIARRAGGWSPAGVPVDELAPLWATVLRLAESYGRDPEKLELVVRAATVLAPSAAGPERASYEGDAAQVAGDVDATHRIGADEVVLRLGGDLSLDEALDGYARIAEATERLAAS